MINSFNALRVGQLDACNPSHCYPIMRWMSGEPENLAVCAFADTMFFKCKPKVIYSILSLCPKKGFIKYPKKTKVEEQEKEEIVKEAIQKIYNWSDLEYEKNRKAVIISDQLLSWLNSRIGFDKKECKKLGIEFQKVLKYEYKESPKTRGLFAFA